MSLPDPPGSTGLPLIGETLDFLRDSYGFTARRVEAYGPVFQTSILGKKTVVISGPQACMRWVDHAIIQRADSMPDLVLQMFGGVSLPLLDGPAHATRKRLMRSAFTGDQLASYAPDLQALTEGFLAGAAGSEIAAAPALKELAIACICKNVMGLDPGPEVDALVADYQIVLAAPSGVPLDLPGTSLRRAIAARERIFATLDRLIADRRAAPGADGLSVLLQASAPDGQQIDDVSCRLELHHVVLAGYIIFGEFVAALIQLDRTPEVRDRLRAEVQARSPEGPVTLAALGELPLLDRVVRELKRHTPVVNTFFGIAKQDFELRGYNIPKGRSVMLSLTECNWSKETWSEPRRFDPERFSPQRREHERHEHAYVPQGAGRMDSSHLCVGLEYTTLFMSVFLIHLMRGYDWTLPEQDLDYDFSKIPAEPRSGLRVRLSARQG